MIAEAFAPGTGFKGLADYLEYGHPGAAVEPDRVAWIETRNLPTENLHAAARIMAATARDSDSIQPPLYHFIISFAPDDPVDRETMRRVADRTLRDLGLQDYQAVIVAHRDRAHSHLHIMVNRVHPVRLNVWSNWFDWQRIERSLRKQEEELGLRSVPGKHAPVPAHAPNRAPAPRRIRGSAEFLARVQAQARPHLLGAHTWDEVERGLGEHGLSVQIKNGGMVVTDGTYEVKASEVDRAASRNHLERRLGPLGAYRARQAVARRTLDERAARVERAQAAAEQAPPVVPSDAPQVEQRTPAAAPAHGPAPVAAPPAAPPPTIATPSAPERSRVRAPVAVPRAKVAHRRIAETYHAAMERLYLSPRSARAKFRAALLRDGREAAVRTLRDRPEAFGFVLKKSAPTPVSERSQDAAREAYRWSGHLEATGRADALRVAGELREQAAATAYDEARTTLSIAESRLKAARAYRDHVRNRVRQLAKAAGQMYKRPRKALWKLAREVRRVGADRAADALQSAPERFGALRGVERRHWWRDSEWDTSAAREKAPAAAGHLRGLDPFREQAATAGELRRAQDAVRLARSRVDELRPFGEHTRGGERERLAAVGRRLDEWERAGRSLASKLRPMLPRGAAGLLRTARTLGRTVIEAADPERDRSRERGHDRGRGLEL